MKMKRYINIVFVFYPVERFNRRTRKILGKYIRIKYDSLKIKKFSATYQGDYRKIMLALSELVELSATDEGFIAS